MASDSQSDKQSSSTPRTDAEIMVTEHIFVDAAPLSPLATPIPDEIAQLAEFYAVEDLAALVRVQANHVERLQKKLPPLKDEFPRTPREG